MAVHAILEPRPARPAEVLVHGQGIDVAEPAMLEVARRGVVERVGLLPVVVRRQGEHPEDRADDVRRARRPEERGVPAVVLDDEQANEEEGRGYGKEQGEPVADPEARVHECPRAGEQRRGGRELPHAAFELRTLVARQARRPCRFVDRKSNTSELQSPMYLVCRLLLEKKKKKKQQS